MEPIRRLQVGDMGRLGQFHQSAVRNDSGRGLLRLRVLALVLEDILWHPVPPARRKGRRLSDLPPGQPDIHFGAEAGGGIDLDLPAMVADHLMYLGQTHAGAVGFG